MTPWAALVAAIAPFYPKVEHPFHVIKNLFKYRKTRYRGLARNTAQLQILFGLANRVIAGWRLRVRDALRVPWGSPKPAISGQKVHIGPIHTRKRALLPQGRSRLGAIMSTAPVLVD